MKKSHYTVVLLSLLLLFLAGCESQQQVSEPEVIRPEEVKYYTNTPGEYVVKGTVTATSKPNMTLQERQDYFIQETSRQAANMGANGVLILNYTGKGPSETVDVYRDGRYIPVPAHTETVTAQAIYVRGKN